MLNPTPPVNCQYGAPMGRPAYGHGAMPTSKFILRRIPINSGGYDSGGAYWGIGAPLYWYCAYETDDTVETGRCHHCGMSQRSAINSDACQHKFDTRSEEVEVSDYIRASDRDHAKAIVTAKYPGAKFYR